jgi:hypothetical protein
VAKQRWGPRCGCRLLSGWKPSGAWTHQQPTVTMGSGFQRPGRMQRGPRTAVLVSLIACKASTVRLLCVHAPTHTALPTAIFV